MNCLKKRFIQDWLCRERLGGKKRLFYYCECVYEESTGGRKGRNGKLKNGQGNISNTSLLFHFLKSTLRHTKPPKMSLICLCFLFLRILSASQWLWPRLGPYLPLLCTTSPYWTSYLISVSTGSSLALSHSSISSPCWLSIKPTSRRPHHNRHCFHSVTLALTPKDLPLSQSLPFPTHNKP